MLFYLLVGHALMDFALQPNAMAIEKSRRSRTELQKEVPWYYWLTAHALVHGGTVACIVNVTSSISFASSILYGILETISHWFIDYARGEGWTNIHVDQALHVICKVVWWAMICRNVTLMV